MTLELTALRARMGKARYKAVRTAFGLDVAVADDSGSLATAITSLIKCT